MMGARALGLRPLALLQVPMNESATTHSPPAGPALSELWASPEPYRLDAAKEATFVAAMREAVAHHRAHSPYYRALCAREGFDEGQLTGPAELHRVPHVFVNVLKRHELLSIPHEDVALHLTSSGTTGQKSQIFFDADSRDRALGTVDACFGAMGLVDREQAVNHLIFAHDPAQAGKRGTTYTDHYLTGLAKSAEIWYALRWDEATQDWAFRPEEANAKLEAFQASGLPLRVIGFPAFLLRVVHWRREQGLPPLAFPAAQSFVLTGGGWKKDEATAIPKEAFRAEVAAGLGIPEANQRDGYGLVEHGLPYLECEAHRFHVPHFARALARDPATLAPLPTGTPGFLNLITPYLLSMPAISLLTSDLAAVHEGCPCGRNTATLELMGRLGTRKNKGCAITAAQLLK